ncbi:hypothetical protein COP1_014303 [Malus domestica]
METRGKLSRLYYLTGSLQRRLDVEYSTPINGHAREVMREASLEKELVIPLFPLLEEKRDKGKNKEKSITSQPVLEEILEAELLDPLLFSLDSRGQSEKERMKYGMPQLIRESSGKGEPTKVDKLPPYRPPPLASKG